METTMLANLDNLAELVHTPLFGLLLTLASYRFALWVYGRSNSLPIFHPFLVASIPVIIVLPLVNVDSVSYTHLTLPTIYSV